MNTARLNELIAVVRLVGARLVETSASTRIRTAEDAGPGVSIGIARDVTVPQPAGAGRFHVLACLTANVEAPGADRPLVHVQATFELTYELPEIFHVTQEDLVSFARTNGVFNVWPYWREFLQATLQRMELPPIVLPLLTMKQIVNDLATERAAPAAESTAAESTAGVRRAAG